MRKQMRRRTRRRRSRLRGRRGTTVASPCSSLTTRTLTGLRLYHAHIVNSFQLKNIRFKNTTLYQIYCLQLFYISDIVSAVFPWQENPHRLGPSGGAGRVQGADGKKIQNPPNFCSDYFEKFKMFVQVMANSESGVTVCLPVARGGKLR